MKPILIFLLFSNSILSFSQGGWAPWPPYAERKLEDFKEMIIDNDTCHLVQGRQGTIALELLADDLPTGTWVAFYDTACTNMTFKFNSIRGVGFNGTCESWYSNGDLCRFGTFINGRAINDSTFCRNGKIWSSVHADTITGLSVHKYYDCSSEKVKSLSYRNPDGTLEGWSRDWKENGEIAFEHFYENGARVENQKYYRGKELKDFEQIIFENDTCYLLTGEFQVLKLDIIADDLPTGTWIGFYTIDKKIRLKFNSTRGVGFTGKCEVWSNYGTRIRNGSFINGKPITDTILCYNNRIESMVHFDSTTNLFEHREYYCLWGTIKSHYYKNAEGKLEGISKDWDGSGRLMFERLYENGVLIEETKY